MYLLWPITISIIALRFPWFKLTVDIKCRDHHKYQICAFSEYTLSRVREVILERGNIVLRKVCPHEILSIRPEAAQQTCWEFSSALVRSRFQFYGKYANLSKQFSSCKLIKSYFES